MTSPTPPLPLAPLPPQVAQRLRDLAERWTVVGAAERSNYALYLIELCDAIGVERPRPASAGGRVAEGSAYQFEFPEDGARVEDPRPRAPTIFIGHGNSPLWRDLKDHLQDHHRYRVTAYETGARAGHAIRDILDELVEQSTFALLVLTAEDETVDAGLRARQNAARARREDR